MKPVLWILIVCISGLSSCKTIILSTYGVHQPRPETTTSLLKFLEKRKGPVEDNFFPRDSVAWRIIIKNPNFRKKIVGTFIFNNQGLIVPTGDSTRCQWSEINRISALHPDSACQVDTTFTFRQIEPLLLPLAAGYRIPSDSTGAFTVVMTWAKFMGKFNDRIFIARDLVKENKQARIRLLFVNLDIQESWHLTGDQRLKID